MPEVSISVSGVSKCYQSYQKPIDRLKQSLFCGRRQYYQPFWPLRDISFELHKGEVVGVVGANGAGKSTLLQILAGTLDSTEGSVNVNGRIAALLELGAGFNPEFTGHENLYMNAALLGLSEQEINEKYQDIVDFADIGDFIYQPVKHYSSGMYVRLAFAITVFVDAEILIIDEALAVGDAAFQAKCFHRLERLLEKGVTILLVTHDVQTVKSYCHRVLYLNKGHLVFDGDCQAGTEMYMQDVLESNKNKLGKVSNKSPVSDNPDAVAFGTEFGCINSLALEVDGKEQDYCQTNQRVGLVVGGTINTQIENPRLLMVIRDSNGYNLFSYNNQYADKTLKVNEQGQFSCTFYFDCRLAEGEYSITVRLDEMHSPFESSLIEKQVNAIGLTVTNPNKTFDARVDLNGSFTTHHLG